MAAKEKRQLTSKSTFEVLLETAKAHGLGKMELNSGTVESGVAAVVLRNCIFCLADKKGTTASCNFLVGLVGGVADEMTGQSHRVAERRCVAKGDPICEITLERVVTAP
jgi:predicted hydrocarbon binding protein